MFPQYVLFLLMIFYQQHVQFVLLPVVPFVLRGSTDPVSPHVVIKIVSKLPWLRLVEAGSEVSGGQTARHGDVTSPHVPHFVFKHISTVNVR